MFGSHRSKFEKAMDARQLKYFVAIYEHGALSRAADQLRVAVSALSHCTPSAPVEHSESIF
jgi:LysR family transcriptional regulator, nitrogen assimilation regulatory protein